MSRENNTGKHLARIFGFIPGLTKTLLKTPESVSRADIIKANYEAMGGIYRSQMTLDTVLQSDEQHACNPFGLVFEATTGSTGVYEITLSEAPSWMNTANAEKKLIPKVQVLTSIGQVDYLVTANAQYDEDAKEFTIAIYLFDVDGTTPKDLDAQSFILLDLVSNA